MTPQTFGMFLFDAGYGRIGRPHPDIYNVVVGNRSIKHYRPAQGYEEWVVAFLSHEAGGGTTAHRKVLLTDKSDHKKVFKEACRWVFQGLKP